jgi:hypothetical protein
VHGPAGRGEFLAGVGEAAALGRCRGQGLPCLESRYELCSCVGYIVRVGLVVSGRLAGL